MVKNYLKIAFKVLLRRKFYTFISLFGIATTLVVLLVAVAILDNFFGAQPPEVHARRSLTIYDIRLTDTKGNTHAQAPGYVFLDRYVRDLPGVELVSIHSWPSPVVSYADGRKIRSRLKRNDGAFWKIAAFDFVEGGPFTDEDDRNARFVAVINETTRRRFFGSDPAVGKWIDVDGQQFRVIGVVHDVSYLRRVTSADIWVPIHTAKNNSYLDEHLTGTFMGTILAFKRADLSVVKSEFRSRLKQVDLPGEWTTIDGSADTPFESIYHSFSGDYSAAHSELLFFSLVGIAILFMALPAVNLINLNVSRIMERSSEIGVRRSFGATSRTLVIQFLVENVILCLIGGAVGLVLSIFLLEILSDSGVIPYAEFELNYRVFGYGLFLSLLFALLSGVYPAWRMSRLNPVEALKQSAL